MRVVWSALANAQLFEICQYYKETGGARLSKAIRLKIFEKTIKQARFAKLGRPEDWAL
jgi:plasmid stabilization system protein ParE